MGLHGPPASEKIVAVVYARRDNGTTYAARRGSTLAQRTIDGHRHSWPKPAVRDMVTLFCSSQFSDHALDHCDLRQVEGCHSRDRITVRLTCSRFQSTSPNGYRRSILMCLQ